jgi:hypothetical protein
MKGEPVDRDNTFNDALLSAAAYDIEHALCMYALDFCTLPGEMIYDKEAIASIASVANRCHIYVIGYTPRVDFVDAKKVKSVLLLSFNVAGKRPLRRKFMRVRKNRSLSGTPPSRDCGTVIRGGKGPKTPDLIRNVTPGLAA